MERDSGKYFWKLKTLLLKGRTGIPIQFQEHFKTLATLHITSTFNRKSKQKVKNCELCFGQSGRN